MPSELETAHKQLAELELRKAEVAKALSAAQAEAAATKAAFNGGQPMSSDKYAILSQKRLAAIRRVTKAQAEVSSVNAELRNANRKYTEAERTRYLAEKRRSTLDEFDLANQLSEPQMLLQRSLAALEYALSRTVRREADTALVETIKDYFRRHGISI